MVSIVQGVGFGLLFVSITTVVLLTLPGNLRNGGTSMRTPMMIPLIFIISTSRNGGGKPAEAVID